MEFPSSSELASTTKSIVRKSEFARNFHYPGTGGGEPGHRAGCASLGARTQGDDLAGDEPISAQPRSTRANQLKILSVENRQRAIVPLCASDHRSHSQARNATLDTTHSHDHRTSAPSPIPAMETVFHVLSFQKFSQPTARTIASLAGAKHNAGQNALLRSSHDCTLPNPCYVDRL